jgi:hypothetical protein
MEQWSSTFSVKNSEPSCAERICFHFLLASPSIAKFQLGPFCENSNLQAYAVGKTVFITKRPFLATVPMRTSNCQLQVPPARVAVPTLDSPHVAERIVRLDLLPGIAAHRPATKNNPTSLVQVPEGVAFAQSWWPQRDTTWKPTGR